MATKNVQAVTESEITFPPETQLMARYMTAEMAAKEVGENVGGRGRGGIRPKIGGSALWNAIDKVVRAFGRIVVIAVAADEDMTIKMSSRASTVPSADVPKIADPRGESTSFWFAVLSRPMPVLPKPAKSWMLRITMK